MDVDLVAGAITLSLGLIAGVLIALMIRLVGRRTGEAAGADRYAQRAFGGVMALTVLLALTLTLAPGSARNALGEVGVQLVGAVPNLLIAVLVLSVGLLLAAATRGLARRVLQRLQPAYADTVGTLAYSVVLVLVVLVLVVLTASSQLGLRTDLVERVLLLVAALALAFALALGLALRPALTAVIAARHVQRILVCGDQLTIDGWTGVVERLGTSSVRLVGSDGTFREVPNHLLLERPVVGNATSRASDLGGQGHARSAPGAPGG